MKLDYNIWEYLTFDHDLVEEPSVYRLEFPEDKTMSFARFLELFYFARRRNFGKAMVETVNDAVKVINRAKRGQASARAITA